MIILLDAGPLGMVSNPRATDAHKRASLWMRYVMRSGHRLVIPEIADYEVRRELLRGNKQESIARLNLLRTGLEYLPITTPAMEQAAVFWAQSRQQGLPTSHDAALDGDAILAAQAATHPEGGENVVIATTNVDHLARFVPAKLWHEIS